MDSLQIIETRALKTATKAFGAHTGRIYSQLTDSPTTERIYISVPEGYKFLGNVNLVVNGVVGVTAIFDGSGLNASTVLNPYLFNASTANLPANTQYDFHIYSLVIKI